MAKVAVEVSMRREWPVKAALPLLAMVLWIVALYAGGGVEVLQWAVRAVGRSVWPILAGVALALLPGMAVLGLLWRDDTATWIERLSLAWCISIALPPLLLESVTIVGLRWNTAVTALYLLVAAAVLAWLHYRERGRERAIEVADGTWLVLPLLGTFVLALLVRLFVVRDLPVGRWGDSYHHTMIAQLLVDNGRLFTSWEPYAPLTTFTYHYGFHSNAAFFHWLTGVPVTRSVVIVGQLNNAAAVVGAYALTVRWSRSHAAGLWAAALTGFANQQPAYSVNWGRYTQLTGHVILVAVLICWMGLLENQRWNWRRISLTAIVTACLMLTHYVVTIFAVLLLGTYVLALVLRRPSNGTVLALLGRSSVASALALLLAAPWLMRTLGGFLGRNVRGMVAQSFRAPDLIPPMPDYIAGPIFVLALVGLLIALARRNWRMALFMVWSQLLVIAMMPQILGLPGAGVVEQLASYTALYITLVPLAGYALGVLQEWIAFRQPALARAASVCGIVGLSVWGIGWQQRILDPYFELFTPADDAAMRWIEEATPKDARFLVNMMAAYGESVFVGTDGGWWIKLLTGRETTLPPITYGSEQGPTPDYAARVNEIGFALRDYPLPSDEGIQVLRDHAIRYVYSGAHIGQPNQFDVAALREHPAFNIVYDRDGVTIFELVQE